VHMQGRGLFRGWWWPVGQKLVFDQMTAPVLEIMDGSMYNFSNLKQQNQTAYRIWKCNINSFMWHCSTHHISVCEEICHTSKWQLF
jgi:hypothetical protein